MCADILYFLKLGGSLITDKHCPNSANHSIIQRMASEIADARRQNPNISILLGHGSGSFGHSAARKYKTQNGVNDSTDWLGFADVWYAARMLNQLVIEIFTKAGLPVLAFPPSSTVISNNHQIHSWDTQPISSALSAGLIPVIQGDTIFDQVIGGTILSTEDLFAHLAPILKPKAILLAGIEAGVWSDYPHKSEIIGRITPDHISKIRDRIQGSSAVDVTGGMLTKVERMVSVVNNNADIKVMIFSGMEPGGVTRALLGDSFGTIISV